METVQCPHCSAPLSSPDEVCKKCFSEKNFTQRIRRIFRVYLPGAFLFSLLLACLGIVARNYIYASYQPAQCTIQSKGVLTVYLNKIDHYEPSLTYSVRTPDGSQEIVTGYKGPYFDGWNDRYLFAEDAEKVLQPYKIGATYACWYTSLRSPHAILVYANYPSGSTSLAFWLTLLMVSLISGMFILVLSAIAELSALAFRGISTQGELISLERLTIDTQTRTIPTFRFKSRLDPPMN